MKIIDFRMSVFLVEFLVESETGTCLPNRLFRIEQLDSDQLSLWREIRKLASKFEVRIVACKFDERIAFKRLRLTFDHSKCLSLWLGHAR